MRKTEKTHLKRGKINTVLETGRTFGSKSKEKQKIQHRMDDLNNENDRENDGWK